MACSKGLSVCPHALPSPQGCSRVMLIINLQGLNSLVGTFARGCLCSKTGLQRCWRQPSESSSHIRSGANLLLRGPCCKFSFSSLGTISPKCVTRIKIIHKSAFLPVARGALPAGCGGRCCQSGYEDI